MSTLQQIAQAGSQWDLPTFVQVTNDLLPQFLGSDHGTSGRALELLNPRLVRYYTSKGVLDRPWKEGKEARYVYRHLLQILVIRRLLGDGYSISAIQSVTTEKNDVELEALLQGGVQLTVETRNPALAFLHAVKARSAAPSPMPPASPMVGKLVQPSPPSVSSVPSSPEVHPEASHWRRITILPGLEIHIRQDFTPPTTPQESANLLQLIAQKLKF
jgi:DNA-binding transcriptional MerR regulator